MSDDGPLNPRLYDALKRVFREVLIARKGVDTPYDDRRVDGKMVRTYRNWGESYRVRCPWCRDHKPRLYINYMFGVEGADGRPDLRLANCFNEGCLSGDYERRKDLVEMLVSQPSILARARLAQGKDESEFEEVDVFWPGHCTDVAAAPVYNKARKYLEEDRGYDAEELSRLYQVKICRDSIWWAMPGRIVIPVFKKDELVAWLGRYPEDLPWHDKERKKRLPVKYFNTPGVRFERLLYQIDVARQYRTGVVVEGTTDVWAGGGPFTAIFKSVVSPYQRRDLFSIFKGGQLVFCLDPEDPVKESLGKFLEEHESAFDGEIVTVWLPKGRDPGSFDQDFLWNYIEDAAKKQGVRVRWEKR